MWFSVVQSFHGALFSPVKAVFLAASWCHPEVSAPWPSTQPCGPLGSGLCPYPGNDDVIPGVTPSAHSDSCDLKKNPHTHRGEKLLCVCVSGFLTCRNAVRTGLFRGGKSTTVSLSRIIWITRFAQTLLKDHYYPKAITICEYVRQTGRWE